MAEPVSAVLIVKDEEESIGRCLKSLQNLDETVVLDTGSSDATVEICETLGARVVRTEPIAPFHFAEARNRALAEVRTPWGFTIDADEVLRQGSTAVIRKALEDAADTAAFFVTFVDRAPDGDRSVSGPKMKLFRKDGWTWTHRVHEELSPLRPGTARPLPEAVVEHLPRAGRPERRARNLALLELCVKEEPGYLMAWRKLGQELMLAGRHAEAASPLARYVENAKDGPIDMSQAMIWSGRCAHATGKFDEGMRWFLRAAETAPDRREPLYEGAIALIKACRLEEALSWLDRLLAIPRARRPMSLVDVPGVWGDEPLRMVQFCKDEIARAEAALKEMRRLKRGTSKE